MKRLILATTALTLLAAPAFAQDRHDDRHDNNMMMMNHDDHHPGNMMMQAHNWHKGDRIGHDDWNRGERVSDYRRYHLSRPPRGYEWRRVDNNYVLAAAATGLIASVIAASH
ncbi:MAG TPA: RcnB family protein [Rhizomicrobium sp.]|nr:RcnB family protein [Rhizomicrobium sp.]